MAQLSNWLGLATAIILVGLPSIFSTPRDKHFVAVPTPGPIRVAIELLLYAVAAVAPWFVWPTIASGLAVAIVVASIGVGIPRLLWLINGTR